MTSHHAVHLPTPYQEQPGMGPVTLRDGTRALVKISKPDDLETVKQFYHSLSPAARESRFMGGQIPSDKDLAAALNSTDRTDQCSLVVSRTVGDDVEVIAIGSYQRITGDKAEFAVTVLDDWRNKGLGTLLLERLADMARRQGISQFEAYTTPFNRSMLSVFRHSGYSMDESNEEGMVVVDLSMRPSPESVEIQDARNRQYTAKSLAPVFSPASIAVVGASRRLYSIGRRVLEELIKNRYKGKLFPVNPNADTLLDYDCYPSVKDLPVAVELAIIVLPADKVLAVVKACGKKGVRSLLIISAGFAESRGKPGRDLQDEITRTARMYGMRMIGPNCLGIINTNPVVSMNASFSPVFPPPGRIAMASQSGALGLAILSLARKIGLGLSSFVSMGNKADVSGNDLIQYWMEDTGTDVILLYLEGFKNPRRFARIARMASRTKPIVCVKGSRTAAGQRASGSHTAVPTGRDVSVDALFHQTGVIRCQTLEEMFSTAQALVSQPLPRGRRVGVISNAGGPGILCADACVDAGLDVLEFPQEVKDKLAAFLPATASMSNPVDMIASARPDHFKETIQTVMRCEEVDMVVVIYIPVGTSDDRAVIASIVEGVDAARAEGLTEKPVFACLMRDDSSATVITTPGGEDIPVFVFPEGIAEVMARLEGYADWKAKPTGSVLEFEDADAKAARAICKRVVKERGESWLTTEEVMDLSKAFCLPVLPTILALNAREAVHAAKKIGYPVAAKIASNTILQKTDVDGVFLNLNSSSDVRKAFTEMHKRLKASGRLEELDGMHIQPMLTEGVEVMVGVDEDPTFGPLLAFGLGGIHVEIIRDICYRVTPLEDRDAAEMVREIRGYLLLEGYRGHPPADIEAIEELLLRVSMLVEEIPEIQAIELNPVFALAPGKGCAIADARIKVGEPTEDQPVRYTDMG